MVGFEADATFGSPRKFTAYARIKLRNHIQLPRHQRVPASVTRLERGCRLSPADLRSGKTRVNEYDSVGDFDASPKQLTSGAGRLARGWNLR